MDVAGQSSGLRGPNLAWPVTWVWIPHPPHPRMEDKQAQGHDGDTSAASLQAFSLPQPGFSGNLTGLSMTQHGAACHLEDRGLATQGSHQCFKGSQPPFSTIQLGSPGWVSSFKQPPC